MVKQKEVLTFSKYEEFINRAKTVQDKLMIKTMLKCGLRVSELVNMKISWINFKDKILKIQSNKTPNKWEPKYCSIREVPISEDLSIELKQFIGNRKKGYVFRSRKNAESNRFNKDSIIRKINMLSKEILGRNTGTHIFRRTYASYLNNNGLDLVSIQKYLGHSDVKTTFLYLKALPDRKDYDKVRNMDFMKL
jgi:integrase/recombinase XerD